MNARRPAALFVASLVLGGCLLAGAARAADEPPRRTTGLSLTPTQLLVSVGLQDLFGPEDRERLKSGFVTRVLVRVALQEEGSTEPIALAFQRAEIVYDIWDERFRIRITRGAGPDVHLEVRTPEEAITQAAAFWQLPLVDAARLRPGTSYVVAFRGDLNPISEELLADVRRWLVQPAKSGRRLGAGDSFFGSFVSIFVNPRLEDSERQLRFFSQRFDVRQVPHVSDVSRVPKIREVRP
jgi:hypothetical protein